MVKSLLIVLIGTLLLASSSHAGSVVQQDWEQPVLMMPPATPLAFAAALNLGGGQFCTISTVSAPHLLPSSIKAAEEEDLHSDTHKQARAASNAMMSQFPMCTQKQEAAIERWAVNVDRQIEIPAIEKMKLMLSNTFLSVDTVINKRQKTKTDEATKKEMFKDLGFQGCAFGLFNGFMFYLQDIIQRANNDVLLVVSLPAHISITAFMGSRLAQSFAGLETVGASALARTSSGILPVLACAATAYGFSRFFLEEQIKKAHDR